MDSGSFATVNGITFRYQIQGERTRPWLTLSNSLLTDLHMWDPQARALTPQFRILRYDQRGHGGTELGSAALTFELLADDLAGLMAAAGVTRSHVVGASMGGTTGAVLAARRPDLVASLVIAGSRPAATAASGAGWRHRIMEAEAQGLDALIADAIRRWFTQETATTQPAWLLDLRSHMSRTSSAAYVSVARLLAAYDIRNYLGQIRCPALFVAGSADPGAEDSLRASTAAVQNAQFRAVESAGHLPSLERAAEFTRLLNTFLEGQG
jgi:3-oxoadipate enol-lactonase